MNVPFNDLSRANSSIKLDLEDAYKRVFERSRYIQDVESRTFEENFANYLEVKHCIGCNNATDALEIILKSLKIGYGDEVILPAQTYVATAEAVVNAGAIPVFADVNSLDYSISLVEIKRHLSSKTKAIIIVHLYGCPLDMEDLLDFVNTNNIYLIEDCAQAHGASYNGKKVGSFGIAGAYSFYPTKNLGALGDGGAIVTNSKHIADSCRMIANHGQLQFEKYDVLGRNSRLDELQAAFLNVKLPYLNIWNNERTSLANRYLDNLKNFISGLPTTPRYSTNVWHLFIIKIKERDYIQAELLKQGIYTKVHYKQIVPELNPFFEFNKHSYPIAHENSSHILSLPLFPGLSFEEVDYVCEKLIDIIC